LLGEIFPDIKEIFNKLSGLKDVEKISLAGSVRRRKETIGDVDFLVTVRESKKTASIEDSASKIMDYFVSLPGVVKIWGKGRTKSSVRMAAGFDMDIRVVPERSYGAALQYFTGSKEHNIVVRTIAMNKGLKLSEYGLFKGQRMIASETEEEIYKILGMQTPPPEIRETGRDRGCPSRSSG